jgi:cephalosporin hydroxylase
MTANGVPSASLRSWKEYFTNANIFAADIDENILIDEERISTFHCDQLNVESIKKMWSKLNDIEFEIIILDGMHSFEANMLFFKYSIRKLKANGYLIIEDIHCTEVEQYKNIIEGLEFSYPNLGFSFFNL